LHNLLSGLAGSVLSVSSEGVVMPFLAGLFLGCSVGFMFACLCIVARQKIPKHFTESSNSEVIERAAWSLGRESACPRRGLAVKFLAAFHAQVVFPIKKRVEWFSGRCGLAEEKGERIF